jgi:formamidopyrimidine-DNA glycosylase
MPELPEVERARSLLAEYVIPPRHRVTLIQRRRVAEGKRIVAVETFEDNIVYAGGIVHTDFAVFEGQIVDRVLRVGKQAYFTTRDGPSALVHLGMCGSPPSLASPSV